MKNKKVVMGRRTEIYRFKKNTSREHDRDRARGEKNQQGEGWVTGPWGSEREGTQSKE